MNSNTIQNLPEKWYVILNSENKETLNKWRKTDSKLYNDCDYECIKYDKYGTSLNYINAFLQYYQEITFEQFKKYVLKEEIVVEEVIEQPITENKTELEIWLENTKSLNLSLEDLEKYIGSGQTCNYYNIYTKLEGNYSKGRAKILFDKWNNKIIEPLPQFKVIESIETITKVENNEGNQFFIGDVVISDSGFIQTIKSFRYNVNKDNILATTNVCNQISIARLEHYIEPKVEETLLEKAKRLYPIGTKFRVACIPKYIGTVKDHKDYPFQDVDIVNLNTIENIDGCTGMTVFYKGKWAEIINE